jgi:triosephosphate isomerase
MAERKPIIAGNWKMHKTCQEAGDTAARLARKAQDVAAVDVMIAPPFTALAVVSEAIKGSPVRLGAQNLFWEDKGAFTGEVSGQMLVSAGCDYVIIGHSERRQYFGETDETVNKRLRASLASGLIPVMCVGESEDEREQGKTFSVLDKQVKMGLEGFLSADLNSLVIAYEPVWAIGTGKTATSDQAQEVHHYLRSMLADLFGAPLAQAMRILYGGSVKPDNVKELMSMPDIDGALVGGASLDPDTFSRIVHY